MPTVSTRGMSPPRKSRSDRLAMNGNERLASWVLQTGIAPIAWIYRHGFRSRPRPTATHGWTPGLVELLQAVAENEGKLARAERELKDDQEYSKHTIQLKKDATEAYNTRQAD